ncbi:restriction endonuclease subunit S [Brevibacterium antiquum]|uniref:Type I restriction enzyme, S subunit n=1 Tax=Brevibacterium antiquum TaxID=234835 RepID=A0A2H1JFD6_9MICO|nr:restriction endonuclease subunit S [Brevibacterium antiquum]SMX86133.1 type I restriction enzyme, S subunit [Brevibacterium antiquum]
MSAWRLTTWGSVVELQRGFDITKSEQSLAGGVPVVSSGGVSSYHDRSMAEGPGVVIGRKGTLGRVHFVQGEYWPHDTTLWVKDFKGNDPRFVYYSLQQLDTDHFNVGSASPTLNRNHVYPLPVRWPESIRIQRAIAEVLGALDDKIASNETLTSKLMEMGELKYLLGTEGADSCWMSDVLEPVLGGTPSRSDDSLWDGSIPWVSAKDISRAQAGFVIDTDEGISEEAAAPTRLRPLDPGSVVLTARGTVGAVARLSVAASINQSCYGFATGRVPAGCLYFLIKGSVAQAQAMAHGSVFDTITKKTFENVSVPELTREEWLDLESRVGPMVSASESAVIESRQLACTRDELLPLLVSGKITVKDAENVVSDAV